MNSSTLDCDECARILIPGYFFAGTLDEFNLMYNAGFVSGLRKRINPVAWEDNTTPDGDMTIRPKAPSEH